MRKSVTYLVIGLFFGAFAGFLVASTTLAARPPLAQADSVAHDHSAHDHGDGSGDHDAHEALVEAGTPAPTIELEILPDGPQSRALHIRTTNFTFAPRAIDGAHVPGEGHAHVYVNGIKIARAYSNWIQIDALPSGDHEIRVTLNANSHGQLAVEGQPVEATTHVRID